MNLAVDIGNTRIKLGVFKQDELIYRSTLPTLAIEELLTLATNHRIENIILSNVANPLDAEMVSRLRRAYRVTELDASTPLPIDNQYETPGTLGRDRLAAVAGAYALFPGEHCLVIDAGTCITYDLLRKDGAYLGGNIAPGVAMRLRAMHAFTANLPLLEPGPTSGWLGKSTEAAMRNGAQEGAGWEAGAFIAHCRQQFPDLRVVLTGGDADFFGKKLKSKIFVNSDLVLFGLNKILNYNVELAK